MSPSAHPDAEVDYLFAQVDPSRALVDTKPTCGNMLAGVGPFALEAGMVTAGEPTTQLVIRNVNTGSFIDATVQTPGGAVTYRGDYAISGVPGTGAPIELRFRHVVGSKTGAMLPTGQARDTVGGMDVTCIDVAMPMVIARAASFGKTGYESPAELNDDAAFLARAEQIRAEAGRRMGFGDVSSSVIPKFAIVARPKGSGHLASRYLTPWQCHPSYAVSGSICVAAAAALPGTVAGDACAPDERFPTDTQIEHPSGTIEVALDVTGSTHNFEVRSAGLRRTARKLMDGFVYVPQSTWPLETAGA